MRIAQLVAAPGVPVLGPSGASAHVRGLYKGFREAGCDVTLYAARRLDRRGAHGEVVEAIETGVGGWPSWLDRYRDLAEVHAARRLARRVVEDALAGMPPDLVVERHALHSDAGWRVGRRLGLPWILEVNAPLCEERSRFEVLRRPAWSRAWEREVLRAAPAVAAVSTWLVRWLSEEVGCANVFLVPNGVSGLAGDRAAGRARLGLAEAERALGFLGSMRPWHGTSRLARLASATDCRLVLIGTGEVAGVEGALRTGFLDGQALADAVAALDVAVAPYPPEAPPWFCPLKILDCRAQGTPVVASDLGDAARLVGEGGAVVPAGDDDAFIEAIRALVGRRMAPLVRPWSTVAGELVAAAGLRPPRAPDGGTGAERPGSG